MQIRNECPDDRAIIGGITRAAFATHPFSQQTEAEIIDALRDAGALHLSLVAEEGQDILGHAAFSPVEIDGRPGGWYGLGPISVRPDRQRQGIGGALLREGLAQLKDQGAAGVVLVGDPAYYTRFGPLPGLRFDGAPAHYFMGLVLNGPRATGSVTFHPGFGAH
ncbi:GNAT family N-acetyltransferase [Pseudodonghicola xiamenensis]|uniref:GNAT family N-acetyltransferase n=1 Tax=Pseudodonghicola xiamenensis TaxID=337702 RepID=A0A8J3HBM9_9RHOB|nr:N-acetyltransferase [Pseudodonghicola xiamenensis]GHG99004.1 GNAT family N-acetyltransferase [Pseudodonghicola xiamenensis]